MFYVLAAMLRVVLERHLARLDTGLRDFAPYRSAVWARTWLLEELLHLCFPDLAGFAYVSTIGFKAK